LNSIIKIFASQNLNPAPNPQSSNCTHFLETKNFLQ
jgi:hypothetical protein